MDWIHSFLLLLEFYAIKLQLDCLLFSLIFISSETKTNCDNQEIKARLP